MERRRGLGNRGSSRSRAGVENIEASDPNIKKQQKARVRKGEGNQHTQESLEHRGPPLSQSGGLFFLQSRTVCDRNPGIKQIARGAIAACISAARNGRFTSGRHPPTATADSLMAAEKTLRLESTERFPLSHRLDDEGLD